ncbi:MAG: hypothetical protein D6797_00935, partial [Bdellovibrio sp.]
SMRILSLIRGHISFALKQSSTPALLILYPLLVILLFGIALTLPSDNVFKVGVFGNDALFSALKEQPNLEILDFGSKDEMVNAIKDKRVIMGISSNYNEDGSKSFDVLFDSTKKPIVTALLIELDNVINKEMLQSGKSLLSTQRKLSIKLVEAKKRREQMDIALVKLKALRAEMLDAKAELEETLSSLNKHEQELKDYNNSLSSIDDAVAKIDTYYNKLGSLYNYVDVKRMERDQAVTKIDSSITKLNTYEANIDNVLNYVALAKNENISSLARSYLLNIDALLTSVRYDIENSKQELLAARANLQSIDFALMEEEIVSARTDLLNAKHDLTAFRKNSADKIGSLLSEISVMKGKVSASITRLDELYKESGILVSESEDVKQLIDELLTTIEDFTGKKPKDLLPPSVNSTGVFEHYTMTTVNFPNLVGITMSLGAILLPMLIKIKMRDQGAYMRIKRSGLSPLSITLAEFVSNYSLLLLQTSLLLFVGVFFFSVSIDNPLNAFVILFLSPLLFVAIGVFLSQLVKRTSTAFLTSLIISIPMILVSGIVIPMEFLAKPVQYIGIATPLYVLADLIAKLSFRGLAVTDSVFNITYIVLGSLVLFLSAALLSWRDGE